MYPGMLSNGTITIGGVDPRLSNGPILYVPSPNSSSWHNVEVFNVTLGSVTIPVQGGMLGAWAILDTGTNDILFPTPMYQAAQKAICGTSPNLAHCDDFFTQVGTCFAMTDAEVEEIVGRLSGRAGYIREQAGLPPRNLRAVFTARTKDTDGVRAARLRLIDAGLGKDAVARFTPVQVVLLDDKREYEERRDAEHRLLGVKAWEIDVLPRENGAADGLFAELVPRVGAARLAQTRIEQRIALLRHVEVLRMYAAKHGKFPNKPDDVGVPVPADPVTNKPFGYEVTGATVRVGGYEITLAK